MVEATSLHEAMSASPLNLNQMIRWVNTKEEHAAKIITLVSEYCLCQRVKPAEFESEAAYLEALKLHHKVMQCAMKAKQSMNTADADALEAALGDLGKMYTK